MCSQPTPRRTFGPPTYAPPPTNDAAAEHEAEIQLEREREETRARDAAEASRKQEDFEKDKSDAVRSLKGLDEDDRGLKAPTSDDFNLKGLDTDTGGNSESSLELKGIDEESTASIYWRSVSVPAACLVAGEIQAGRACVVIDGYQLWKILRGPDPIRGFEKWVLEKGATKAVVISLGGPGENLDRKLELVKAMYQAEARVFGVISLNIAKEMAEDSAKRAWIRDQAKLDNEAVKTLKERVYSEKAANVQASLDYFRHSPSSKGVRFNCSSACQDLIRAANGIEAWQ